MITYRDKICMILTTKSWYHQGYTLAQWASNYWLFYNAIVSFTTASTTEKKKTRRVHKIFIVVA